jgi:hypothetical protein
VSPKLRNLSVFVRYEKSGTKKKKMLPKIFVTKIEKTALPEKSCNISWVSVQAQLSLGLLLPRWLESNVWFRKSERKVDGPRKIDKFTIIYFLSYIMDQQRWQRFTIVFVLRYSETPNAIMFFDVKF